MTKSSREAYALPTPELTAKGNFREEAINASPGAPKRMRRLDSNELDRLLFAGSIMPDEHSSLELFRQDMIAAGMIFMPKASLMPGSTSGSAQFISDAAFSRVRRVSDQMAALNKGLPGAGYHVVLAALMDDRRVDKDHVASMQKAAQILEDFYKH